MVSPSRSTKRDGAGNARRALARLVDCDQSMRGGTPDDPGLRQYVFQPSAISISMPANSRDEPLARPATSLTRELSTVVHGVAIGRAPAVAASEKSIRAA